MEKVSNQGEGGELSGDQDQAVINLKYVLRLAVGCRGEIAKQLDECEIVIAKLEHKIKELENVIQQRGQ